MVSDGTWALLDNVFAVNSTANANLNWISTSYGFTMAGAGSVIFAANQGHTGDGSTTYFTMATRQVWQTAISR
jgi:hypothetical protein